MDLIRSCVEGREERSAGWEMMNVGVFAIF